MRKNELAASLQDPDAYIRTLASLVATKTNVVAWSFGGLLAIKLADAYPALINKIAFIASTSKFVHHEVAISPHWFKKFQLEFVNQPGAALKKFLSLQATGDEFTQSTTRRLREVSPIKTYDYYECSLGLSLMENLDLGAELKRLPCKVAFIHGECDAVLPIQAGRTAAALCNAAFYSIPVAGHAPHVSHPHQISELILNFFC